MNNEKETIGGKVKTDSLEKSELFTVAFRDGENKKEYDSFKELMENWTTPSNRGWQDFSEVKPEKGQYLVYSNGCMDVDIWTGASWVGHLFKVDYWMNPPPPPMTGGAR